MDRIARIRYALDSCGEDDIVDIIAAAVDLQEVMYKDYYSPPVGGDELFRLRKALEGVFGHDLPTQERESE